MFSSRTVAQQPQPDRQRIPQCLKLLGGFQLIILADRPQGGLIGAGSSQTGQYLLPERVVQIARTIAGDPRQLAERENRVASLAAVCELPIEKVPRPALCGLSEDDGVGRREERHSSTQTTQTP